MFEITITRGYFKAVRAPASTTRWCTPALPACGRRRQEEEQEFKAILRPSAEHTELKASWLGVPVSSHRKKEGELGEPAR